MIFEIQQEPLFHLATEGLPGGPDVTCFEARNPARDALSSNFEQVDATHAHRGHGITSLFGSAKTPLDEFPALAAKYTCRQAPWEGNHLFGSNLEPKNRRLRLIASNLQPIYQFLCIVW